MRTVPRASLAIPLMLEGRVGLATVTTTLTQPTQMPVTRRLGGASGACTTRKESTASSAASATTGTPSSRTVGVRCAFVVPLIGRVSAFFFMGDPLLLVFLCFGNTLVPCSER